MVRQQFVYSSAKMKMKYKEKDHKEKDHKQHKGNG